MSEDYVLHIPFDCGDFSSHVAPTALGFELLGLTVTALPPGRVEVDLRDTKPFINVIAQRPTVHLYDIDGRDRRSELAAGWGGGVDVFAGGLHHRLAGENGDWELLVELDETRLAGLAAEAWENEFSFDRDIAPTKDLASLQLGRMALDHMRSGATDRLYIEGLSIALVARNIGRLTSRSVQPPLGGTDPRIARAMDYIEAHLGDDLSVAEIAAVAAMSPSWFQSAFRAVMGQPVFAYVRERRLERARVLLADRRLSLSQIAYTCGFSSHSHMSRLFRVRYGISPRDMR